MMQPLKLFPQYPAEDLLQLPGVTCTGSSWAGDQPHVGQETTATPHPSSVRGKQHLTTLLVYHSSYCPEQQAL